MLQVLLEKLEAIRKQLGSDKVFDVIGRLFQNTSLRGHMAEALTTEGERRVVERVSRALAGNPVSDVKAAEARIYGPTGDVAPRLDALRDDMERERYLQLLPGYVRRLVEMSAALLELEIRGDLDGLFSFAPRRAGALDQLLPALEGYPPAARERLCVRRPSTDDSAIWLHPGEPVFDALAAQIRRTFARDAARGAIFADPKASEPYFFHLAMASVEQEGELLEQLLIGLRQGAAGALVEYPVEHLLLLHGAPGVAPGAVQLASKGIGMRAAAAAYARNTVAVRMADAHRSALQGEQPEQRRRIGFGFDLRAAELAGRRTRLSNAASGSAAAAELDAVKQEQRALPAERRQALQSLETAPERIAAGDVRFLAHALVVSTQSSEELGALRCARGGDGRADSRSLGDRTRRGRTRRVPSSTRPPSGTPRLARLRPAFDAPGW